MSDKLTWFLAELSTGCVELFTGCIIRNRTSSIAEQLADCSIILIFVLVLARNHWLEI